MPLIRYSNPEVYSSSSPEVLFVTVLEKVRGPLIHLGAVSGGN